MIAKCFHFQFREVWRSVRGIILLSLLITVISCGVTLLRLPALSNLALGLAILVAVGTVFVNLFMVLSNDYQLTQGKRAYFFRAIPAQAREHFIARFLNYSVFIIIAALVFFIQFVANLVAHQYASGMDGIAWLRTVAEIFGRVIGQYGLYIIAYIIFALILNVLSWMFAITVGSEARFHHMGISGPILMYVIYYVVMQVVTLLGMLVIPLAVRFNPMAPGLEQADIRLVFETMIPEFIEMIKTGEDSGLGIIGIGFIPLMMIVAGFLGVITYRSMRDRLSLH